MIYWICTSQDTSFYSKNQNLNDENDKYVLLFYDYSDITHQASINCAQYEIQLLQKVSEMQIENDS